MSRSLFRQLNLRQIALLLLLPSLVCACASHAMGQLTGTVSVGGEGNYGYVYGSATASYTGDCTGTDDDGPYYGEVTVEVGDEYYNSILWIPYTGGNSVSTGGQASPGDYSVTGYYSGFTGMDSNGNGCSVSGDTEYADAEVPYYPTATTVSLTTSSFQEGAPVTIPVAVANNDGAPGVTGTATLYYGSAALASATITDSYNSQTGVDMGVGTITASSKGVPPGNYSVYVSYSGDVNCAPSNSSPFTITVLPSQQATSATLSVSPNPVLVNETVGVIVSITPTGNVTPTGTINLLVAGKSVATLPLTTGNGGAASLFFPADLPAGTYSVQALYSGDKFNLPSTSNEVSVIVDSTTTTTTDLSVSPASVTEGQAALISVRVFTVIGNGVPTGTVTISANGETLAALRLTEAYASLNASTAGYTPGTYSVVASYSGDATDTASHSSTQTVTILQATTVTVTASPNPVTQGTVTTLTATVKNGSSPVASGSVSFSEGGNSLGSASLSSSGVAQLPISTSALAAGTYTIEASFAGNSNDPAASGTVSLTVK